MSFDKPRQRPDRYRVRDGGPVRVSGAGTPVIDEWSLPRTAEHVPAARRRVGVSAGKVLGLAERAAEAELAAGELLANATVHGAGPDMRVRVIAYGRVLRVEVRDGGTGPIGEPGAGPLAESGRGLLLVAALTRRYGVETSGHGTCAWFEAEP